MSFDFNKKLQYIFSVFLTQYIETNFPQYAALIKAYAEYMDDDGNNISNPVYNKIIKIVKNNDPDQADPVLLDYYMRQFFNELPLAPENYQIKDSDKRFFINMSKYIANSKGNKMAMIFLIRYLNNIALKDGSIVPRVGVYFRDNEAWWDKSGTYKPFTYSMTVSYPENFLKEIIRLHHPAGFVKEIILDQIDYDNNISTEALGAFNDVGEITKKHFIIHNGKYTYGSGVWNYGQIKETPQTLIN